MFYYLYEIRNNLNGKIYVGVHKTQDLNDGYMGSGKVINAALKKYGIENFTKVILETFENAKAMYARETEIVNDEFLARDDVYNLRRGGHGGFDYINKHADPVKRRERSSRNSPFYGEYGDKIREKAIKAIKSKKSYIVGLAAANSMYENNPLVRKRVCLLSKTSEAIQKWKDVNAGFQSGAKNSQYGTMWITNDIENKKIKKNALIPDGWKKGRKLISK